ncbi:MAG: hypothetical protein IT382_07260 [Deltaproteobacteria bacterium]|nr:hypothetical protein [Deltaproteobacteria bacterium]
MNKAADPDELLAQIRAMSVADRHRVTAGLLDDLDAEFVEPPALIDELRRRAQDAILHPGRGIALDESISQARAAAAKVRAQKA